MAKLYPFSNETAHFLEAAPAEGASHRWLAQAAGRLREVLTPERCSAFLQRCCETHVRHRPVPEREIEAAVAFAYGQNGTRPNYGRGALDWPAPGADAIERVLATVEPVFDGETSTGLRPDDVLPALFAPGELVCSGMTSERAVIRPVEAVMTDAHLQQFIVVNPMRGAHGVNRRGVISARCQDNVMARRHLVAEFDDPGMSKRSQALLASALGDMAPLVMAVDSGGKSVHAWYRVDGLDARGQARFFAVACLLGADRTRWDVCGWLRMPGGLRQVDGVPKVRQRILYWNGQVGQGGPGRSVTDGQ